MSFEYTNAGDMLGQLYITYTIPDSDGNMYDGASIASDMVTEIQTNYVDLGIALGLISIPEPVEVVWPPCSIERQCLIGDIMPSGPDDPFVDNLDCCMEAEVCVTPSSNSELFDPLVGSSCMPVEENFGLLTTTTEDLGIPEGCPCPSFEYQDGVCTSSCVGCGIAFRFITVSTGNRVLCPQCKCDSPPTTTPEPEECTCGGNYEYGNDYCAATCPEICGEMVTPDGCSICGCNIPDTCPCDGLMYANGFCDSQETCRTGCAPAEEGMCIDTCPENCTVEQHVYSDGSIQNICGAECTYTTPEPTSACMCEGDFEYNDSVCISECPYDCPVGVSLVGSEVCNTCLCDSRQQGECPCGIGYFHEDLQTCSGFCSGFGCSTSVDEYGCTSCECDCYHPEVVEEGGSCMSVCTECANGLSCLHGVCVSLDLPDSTIPPTVVSECPLYDNLPATGDFCEYSGPLCEYEAMECC